MVPAQLSIAKALNQCWKPRVIHYSGVILPAWPLSQGSGQPLQPGHFCGLDRVQSTSQLLEASDILMHLHPAP